MSTVPTTSERCRVASLNDEPEKKQSSAAMAAMASLSGFFSTPVVEDDDDDLSSSSSISSSPASSCADSSPASSPASSYTLVESPEEEAEDVDDEEYEEDDDEDYEEEVAVKKKKSRPLASTTARKAGAATRTSSRTAPQLSGKMLMMMRRAKEQEEEEEIPASLMIPSVSSLSSMSTASSEGPRQACDYAKAKVIGAPSDEQYVCVKSGLNVLTHCLECSTPVRPLYSDKSRAKFCVLQYSELYDGHKGYCDCEGRKDHGRTSDKRRMVFRRGTLQAGRGNNNRRNTGAEGWEPAHGANAAYRKLKTSIFFATASVVEQRAKQPARVASLKKKGKEQPRTIAPLNITHSLFNTTAVPIEKKKQKKQKTVPAPSKRKHHQIDTIEEEKETKKKTAHHDDPLLLDQLDAFTALDDENFMRGAHDGEADDELESSMLPFLFDFVVAQKQQQQQRAESPLPVSPRSENKQHLIEALASTAAPEVVSAAVEDFCSPSHVHWAQAPFTPTIRLGKICDSTPSHIVITVVVEGAPQHVALPALPRKDKSDVQAFAPFDPRATIFCAASRPPKTVIDATITVFYACSIQPPLVFKNGIRFMPDI